MKLLEKEVPIPGEQKAIATLIELLSAKMKKETFPSSKMRRDAHPKQIGLVKAEFIVEPDLPFQLRVGVFSNPVSYPCWVRFSNQSAPPAPDNVKDIRGVAIKLMGVEGDKVLKKEKYAKTHDFILISTSYFVTKNVVDFAKLIQALVAGKLKLILFFLLHPKIAYNLLSSNKNFGSLLEARFWSVSPYTFGDRIVKYSLKPCSDEKTAIPAQPEDNYLTSVMEKQLHTKEYFFDFMIQFQKDPKKMPTEDLSNAWSEEESPFIKVATLKIPKQVFNTSEQQDYGDNLSFTPWHCLPEHTPLGSVNRGRKVVYDTLSTFRHETNGLTRFEPENFNIH